MNSFTTFSEIVYTRPDIPAFIEEIKAATSRMKTVSDAKEASTLYGQIKNAWQHLDTLKNICEIRNTIDTRDPYYEAEANYLYEHTPMAEVAMDQFRRATLACPYLPALKEEYGNLYFERLEKLLKLTDEKNIENQIEEKKLVQQYHKAAASPLADFHGEQLNFYGLLKKMQHTDRNIRKEALQVWSSMYESIADELNSIYSSLIENRIRQADILGFHDYTEMMYLSMERFDYDRNDVAKYRDMIKKYVVPIVCDIYAQQTKNLNIDQLHYYDEQLTNPNGNPCPEGTTQELLLKAQQMYHELSPETGEFFDFMMEHDLFDLETRPGKQQGGYCTFLSDMKAPFIFSNFNGTSADVDVLTHESGHAFEVYSALRHGVPEELAFSTSEVAEIHSMSMENLTYPWMELFFPGKADEYRLAHLQDDLAVIPYMACVDEFQHVVYEKKMTNAEDRYALWHSLEEKYMPWRNYDGNEFLEKGGFWMQKQHIFMCPFYYIDYSLASMGAFEYYLSSLEDRETTWKNYYALCCAGGKEGYKDLLKIGKLSDPFAEGTVEGIMNKLRPLALGL